MSGNFLLKNFIQSSLTLPDYHPWLRHLPCCFCEPDVESGPPALTLLPPPLWTENDYKKNICTVLSTYPKQAIRKRTVALSITQTPMLPQFAFVTRVNKGLPYDHLDFTYRPVIC